MEKRIELNQIPLEIRGIVQKIIKAIDAQIEKITEEKGKVFNYDNRDAMEKIDSYRIFTRQHGSFPIWQLKTGKHAGAILTCAFEGDDYCLSNNMSNFKGFFLEDFVEKIKRNGKIEY